MRWPRESCLCQSVSIQHSERELMGRKVKPFSEIAYLVCSLPASVSPMMGLMVQATFLGSALGIKIPYSGMGGPKFGIYRLGDCQWSQYLRDRDRIPRESWASCPDGSGSLWAQETQPHWIKWERSRKIPWRRLQALCACAYSECARLHTRAPAHTCRNICILYCSKVTYVRGK